jgi:hypothetical protein
VATGIRGTRLRIFAIFLKVNLLILIRAFLRAAALANPAWLQYVECLHFFPNLNNLVCLACSAFLAYICSPLGLRPVGGEWTIRPQ